MTKMSDAAVPSLLITEGTEPAAPAAGKQRMYIDSTTHVLMLTNSSGTESAVGSAGTPAFGGALAYNSATQSINDSAVTIVTFDSEDFDTATYHSTSSNTGRMTVPTTGKYRFLATVYFNSADADGLRIVEFEKNGATAGAGTLLRGQSRMFGHASNTQVQQAEVVASLTATDFVTVIVFQSSGAAMNIGHATAPEIQSSFSVQFLGT
jgi:hypothetical protein